MTKDGGSLHAEGIYGKGYGLIPKFVMTDTSITLEAKAIYAYFCSLSGRGSVAFPYRDTIIRHLELAKNTYYKHYRLLIEEGYISAERPADLSAANIYTLISNPKKLSESVSGTPDKSGSSLRYKGLKSLGYGVIPKSVMTDERLSAKSKGLYAYLCSFCGAGDCAFPRRDDIIFHLGISEPTYYKCYNALISLGYLTVEQRKAGTLFGVNDYYLNEFPNENSQQEIEKSNISPPVPHPKNCDMKETSGAAEPCPNSWYTKNRYTNFWYAENCDAYINNSNTSNSNTSNSNIIISQSISEWKSQTGRTDANDTGSDSRVPHGTGEPGVKQIDEIFRKMKESPPGGNNSLESMSEQQEQELIAAFKRHIGAKLSEKNIRNVKAYITAAMRNWLLDRSLTSEFSGYRPEPASYDIAEIERRVLEGIF